MREESRSRALKQGEFITLIGGTAVGWPFALRAQQVERMRRLGVFSPLTAGDPQVLMPRFRFAARSCRSRVLLDRL
jgi:hypothetical protein